MKLNLVEHIRLLIRIFILNDLDSMHALGAWYGSGYVNGASVSERISKSYRYYKMAADKGHAEAQYDLGFMIVNGEISGIEYDVGLALIRKSAHSSFVPAQELLNDIEMQGSD